MTAPERCASGGCHRPITRATAIVDRDGRRYCKRHGDRLPHYLRRIRPPRKATG